MLGLRLGLLATTCGLGQDQSVGGRLAPGATRSGGVNPLDQFPLPPWNMPPSSGCLFQTEHVDMNGRVLKTRVQLCVWDPFETKP